MSHPGPSASSGASSSRKRRNEGDGGDEAKRARSDRRTDVAAVLRKTLAELPDPGPPERRSSPWIRELRALRGRADGGPALVGDPKSAAMLQMEMPCTRDEHYGTDPATMEETILAWRDVHLTVDGRASAAHPRLTRRASADPEDARRSMVVAAFEQGRKAMCASPVAITRQLLARSEESAKVSNPFTGRKLGERDARAAAAYSAAWTTQPHASADRIARVVLQGVPAAPGVASVVLELDYFDSRNVRSMLRQFRRVPMLKVPLGHLPHPSRFGSAYTDKTPAGRCLSLLGSILTRLYQTGITGTCFEVLGAKRRVRKRVKDPAGESVPVVDRHCWDEPACWYGPANEEEEEEEEEKEDVRDMEATSDEQASWSIAGACQQRCTVAHLKEVSWTFLFATTRYMLSKLERYMKRARERHDDAVSAIEADREAGRGADHAARIVGAREALRQTEFDVWRQVDAVLERAPYELDVELLVRSMALGPAFWGLDVDDREIERRLETVQLALDIIDEGEGLAKAS